MRLIVALTLALLLSVALPAAADNAAGDLAGFSGLVDPGLQGQVERRLAANPEWARLVRQGKMAVGLVDLNGRRPRYARVNGDMMMYAASLPKIAVLFAAYVSMEEGAIEETEQVRQDLADMIRVSSNRAATRLIDLIGLRKIQAILRDPRYDFYDESQGGGLWVGKRYAADGPRIGDPLHNLSHGATVTQVCRFFYMLARGALISPERSQEMLADLSRPGLHHKFVSQIDRRAPGAEVFRKSGTWRQWHADAVLVKGPQGRNYILVGLVESLQGETILRDMLPAMEDLILPARYVSNLSAG